MVSIRPHCCFWARATRAETTCSTIAAHSLAQSDWRDIKALIEGPGHGGLPGLTMCNIKRDPGEWTVTPFQNLVKSHMALIEKFPNRKPELPEEAALTPHD